VLIHPQSIVHSMVAYRDGSVLAQLGTPDMRTPIAYALSWPERIDAGVERLNLAEMSDLSFRDPDLQRFPCLGLAFEALRQGASAPATLNGANEIGVAAFLEGKIRFDQIAELVGEVMQQSEKQTINCLEDVVECDVMARRKAAEAMRKMV
jgi:1-deoxy-D-xylulose-5-phosphate reductoisomerase